MIALVTGGAGLIGSHIVDLLIQNGHRARILDNLSLPTHPNGKPGWIHPQAEFILGDVRNPDDVERALQGVDWVFHQAADGGFTDAVSHYFSNNSIPTALLYELMRKTRVQRVVVASSQAVYGEGKYRCQGHGEFHPEPRGGEQLCAWQWEMRCPECDDEMQGIPIDERHVNPLLPYALSKHMSEVLALRLGRLYKIPTVALRYSLTYGPRQSLFNPYTGITSIFSRRILQGEPPLIYEDGRQTRDFVFVQDVAAANLFVAQHPAAVGQVFNVGTGVATSLLDFIAMLNEIFGTNVRPKMVGKFRLGDFRHLISDAGALRALGWQPETELRSGLVKFGDWIQAQL